MDLSLPTWVAAIAASAACVVAVVTLIVVWRQLAVQTAAAVLSIAQDNGVRMARKVLFDAERDHKISRLRSAELPAVPGVAVSPKPPTPVPPNEWRDRWKQNADRVCQSFNAAAYLLQRDLVARCLLRAYIRGTRRAILRSRYIAWPRMRERRDVDHGGQHDLWQEFDWLAGKAWVSSTPEERRRWYLPENPSDFGLCSRYLRAGWPRRWFARR
jgi:hypothetical protein